MKSIVPKGESAMTNCRLIEQYLLLSFEFYQSKLSSTQLDKISDGSVRKCWRKVYLEHGTFLKTYTPAVIYFTYENYLLIFEEPPKYEILKQINLKNTKVIDLVDGVLELEEITKGFFTDGKEKYKIKFENWDSSE